MIQVGVELHDGGAVNVDEFEPRPGSRSSDTILLKA